MAPKVKYTAVRPAGYDKPTDAPPENRSRTLADPTSLPSDKHVREITTTGNRQWQIPCAT